MSNFYVCQKCFKPCDVRPPVQHDDRTHALLSVCCGAIVKVSPA